MTAETPTPTPTPEQVEQVAAILRTLNPTEAGGEWSAFGVAMVLDPDAHTPRSTFDTGPPYPSDRFVAIAQAAIAQLGLSGRYVGGTSGHLYHLPPLGTYSVEMSPFAAGHAEQWEVIREHDGARTLYRTERTREDAQRAADHFNAGQPSEAAEGPSNTKGLPMSAALDQVSFTWNDDPAQREPFMVCGRCGDKLCSIEDGDLLAVIVSVATDHTCDAPPAETDR